MTLLKITKTIRQQTENYVKAKDDQIFLKYDTDITIHSLVMWSYVKTFNSSNP